MRLREVVLPGLSIFMALSVMILWLSGYGIQEPKGGTGPAQKETVFTDYANAVTISSLPAYRMLNGINVTFNGRGKYLQPIAGRYAKGIIVNNFRAAGENAHKSTVLITWEDDSVETISAGTTGLQLPANKRAKNIIIQGYSMHERRIFHDTAAKGVLNWEILYEPVE